MEEDMFIDCGNYPEDVDLNHKSKRMNSHKYVCDVCGSKLSSSSSLMRHKRNIHFKEKKVLICDRCSQSYNKREDFKKHWRDCHTPRRNVSQTCPLCRSQFHSLQINNHIVDQHNVAIEIEELVFYDEESCYLWKSTIEKQTYSKFLCRTGSTNRTKKFICHRSGYFQSKSQGIRHLKSQGSKRMDAYCPASIWITKSMKGLHVKFIKTHIGHNPEKDLPHLQASRPKKDDSAKKSIEKIPKRNIISSIRESCDSVDIQREDLVLPMDVDNSISPSTSSTEGEKTIILTSLNDRYPYDISCEDLQAQFTEILKETKTSAGRNLLSKMLSKAWQQIDILENPPSFSMKKNNRSRIENLVPQRRLLSPKKKLGNCLMFYSDGKPIGKYR